MAKLTLLDLSEARAAALERRSLTSESTLAQLGGNTGWGGFGAAKLGRLTNDWASASRAADQDLVVDLRRLRSRARVQAINSPTAAKFLGMVRSNVVGHSGVKLTFRVPQLRKSRSGNGLDEKTNDQLREAWHEWGKKGSCTVCGRYSLRELEQLFVENAARDGEQIVRKVMVPKSVNPFGFQLQLIDADQLDDTYNLLGSASGVQVRMGVEVDQYQKPLAYHIFKGNPYEISYGSASRLRVPADQIIHWFVAHRTGQTRGYPWFAATMAQLNMLDGYFSAELAAARIAASVFASIEDKDKDGAASEIEGDGLNADGSKALDIGIGTAVDLQGLGVTLNYHTPNHPGGAFDPFVKQSGRLIASGMNVAYHKLFNDLAGINYSSGRLGELEERDFWMAMQASLVDNVLEPIYDAWLGSALLNGALDLPLADRKRFCGPSLKWVPRRWGWIDPLKDVQASTLLVQNGFDTHEKILNSQGFDLEDVYEGLAREQELADELGLALGTDIRGQGTSEVNNADATAEDGTTDGDAEPKEGEEKPAAPGAQKPKRPKAQVKPAPAKPKARTGLERGMHPANAALWDLDSEE
ncbi:MAG: phage portal protein [Acidobacteriaceae bacterium]